MASHLSKLPDQWFTPPGLIRVSPQAMELARDFWNEAKTTQPEKDWLIAFSWGDTRRYRNVQAGLDWQDLGPGIDIAAYERHEIPQQAIQIIENMEILIAIQQKIWENSVDRLIDVDGAKRLILR